LAGETVPSHFAVSGTRTEAGLASDVGARSTTPVKPATHSTMASGSTHTPTPVRKEVSKLPLKSNEQGAEERFARQIQIHEHSLVFTCPFLFVGCNHVAFSSAEWSVHIARHHRA
jgi:hypothetical protein